jgi:hypothetical protein
MVEAVAGRELFAVLLLGSFLDCMYESIKRVRGEEAYKSAYHACS